VIGCPSAYHPALSYSLLTAKRLYDFSQAARSSGKAGVRIDAIGAGAVFCNPICAWLGVLIGSSAPLKAHVLSV